MQFDVRDRSRMTANATNNTKNKGFLAVAALGYFVLGMIGTSFAIAPGYASPVFPAAGFAVACLLWSDRKAWPAILVGSFAPNLAISLMHQDTGGPATLIAAGIAVGGSMLGYFDFTISFAGWWTVFIIMPALLSMTQGGINAGNLIMLAVGVILLLDQQGALPPNFSWKLILPVILLVVGANLLFGGGFSRGRRHGGQNGESRGGTEREGSGTRDGGETAGAADRTAGARGTAGQSYKTASAFFGGQDIMYGNEEFTGASYSATFGGLTVNLKDVVLVGDVVITVSAIFGGIELILPDNAQVVRNVTPVLGGVDCKYPSSRDPLAPKVIINGTVTLGGIDIR